jgi:predicted DNA-binding protein (MmcQ/YjbR family)
MTTATFTRLRHAVEQYALSLPGVTRDIKWGADVVFSVADKMFCCLSSEGEALQRMSFKVPVERFLELTDQDGIIPAPYLAKHHWISLEPSMVLSKTDVLALIEGSYRLVRAKLPKKVQATLLELQ